MSTHSSGLVNFQHRRAEVPNLDVNERPLGPRERGVLAPARVSQPGSGRILPVFIMEYAVKDQNFLAAGMRMRIEAGVGPPCHQGRADPVEFMQRHHRQARNKAGAPARGVGVDHDFLGISGRELPELGEDRTPVAGEGCVLRTWRIPNVGAGRVIAMLVGKNAVKHQKLFTAAMRVLAELRAGRIANDAGGAGKLATNPVKPMPPDAGARGGYPGIVCHRRDDNTLIKIGVDAEFGVVQNSLWVGSMLIGVAISQIVLLQTFPFSIPA